MRSFHVGLAAVNSARPRSYMPVPAPPRVATCFTVDTALQADLVLKHACARGGYADALAHLIGCGFGRHERPFPTTTTHRMVPGDLWAVVCYDERATGLRHPPFVLFGDSRHTRSLLDSEMGSNLTGVRPPVDKNHGRCGLVPHQLVPAEIAVLFTSQALVADLQF